MWRSVIDWMIAALASILSKILIDSLLVDYDVEPHYEYGFYAFATASILAIFVAAEKFLRGNETLRKLLGFNDILEGVWVSYHSETVFSLEKGQLNADYYSIIEIYYDQKEEELRLEATSLHSDLTHRSEWSSKLIKRDAYEVDVFLRGEFINSRGISGQLGDLYGCLTFHIRKVGNTWEGY